MGIKPNHKMMQAALRVAEKNETPFGAAIAMGDELFAVAANQTSKKTDPTAHAEMEVIRALADLIQKKDLSGFTLYTTCEPCPMCMSAIIWSNISTVVYGCDILTISNYMNQIQLPSKEVIEKGFTEVELHSGFMVEECEELLREYS